MLREARSISACCIDQSFARGLGLTAGLRNWGQGSQYSLQLDSFPGEVQGVLCLDDEMNICFHSKTTLC